jgi:predicted transport protein
MKKLKTSIEDHLVNKPPEIIAMFQKLHKNISSLPNVVHKATDPYIGYRFKIDYERVKLFVEVHLQIKKVLLHLEPIEYIDPFSKIIIKNNDGWRLNRLMYIENETDLDYAMEIIRQAHKNVL